MSADSAVPTDSAVSAGSAAADSAAADSAAADSAAAEGALALLRASGAADVGHPGGTLLAHLQRVRDRLAAWGARPALCLAGLSHAFYGTDGFPTALLAPARRAELAAVIGQEAEAIVYLYASCDRAATYPTLARPDGAFHDRFTGRTHTPGPQLRRDFAELSAANELDIAAVDPAFRERWGPELLALFTGFRALLGEAAWRDCRAVLAAPEEGCAWRGSGARRGGGAPRGGGA